MAYYVYILKCADKTLYTGSTNDLEKRLRSHNSQKAGARYTRSRRPVVMVYSKKYRTKNIAMQSEYEIKQLSRVEKLVLINAEKI